jgi:hypothetical protein
VEEERRKEEERKRKEFPSPPPLTVTSYMDPAEESKYLCISLQFLFGTIRSTDY